MNMDNFSESDPYATLQISNGEKRQTQTVMDKNNPIWNFITDFPIDLAEGHELKIEVFDEDDVGNFFSSMKFITLIFMFLLPLHTIIRPLLKYEISKWA